MLQQKSVIAIIVSQEIQCIETSSSEKILEMDFYIVRMTLANQVKVDSEVELCSDCTTVSLILRKTTIQIGRYPTIYLH